jgi:hypothetical protein
VNRSAAVRVPPGGQACLRVRARDSASNVSPWSATKCVTVPLDDRSLTARGKVRRLSSALALSGTQSRLDTVGSSVSRAGQTGARVAVVVLRGPGQGAVDVLAGTTRLGRVSLSASSWGRQVVWLPPKTLHGATITIRSLRSRPARVDALAVLR